MSRTRSWFILVHRNYAPAVWWLFGIGIVTALFGGLVPDTWLPVDLSIVLATGLALVVLALWWMLRPFSEDPDNTEECRKARAGQLIVATFLLVFGAALIFVWAKIWPAHGLGVIGAIFAYVGLGRLLVAARENMYPPDKQPLTKWALLWLLRGPAVLLVCAYGFIRAWQTIAPPETTRPYGDRGVAVLTLVLSVLAAPIGLSLLSEDLLRTLPTSWTNRAKRTVLAVFAVGVMGLVVALIVSVPRADDVFTYGTLIVVGLALFVLVGLITGKTQADIFVIVVVLLALVSLAPNVTDGPPAAGDGTLLVALGDSYISGEGAQAFYQGTDVAGKNHCHRASTAFPFVYANAHQREYPGGVVTFACSGATVANLVHQKEDTNGKPIGGTPQMGKYEPVGWTADDKGQTQLEQLDGLLDKRKNDIGLILVTVGGNDAGFTTIGVTCVAPGHCDEQGQKWIGNLTNVRKSLDDGFADLKNTLATHNAQIPVLVVPYPEPIADQSCQDVTLSQSEVTFVRKLVDKLDKAMKKSADTAHFSYMDTMQNALVDPKLQLCGHGPKTGINFVSPKIMNGTPEAQLNPGNWVHNSFHPNEDGHQAMATALAQWLAGNDPRAPKPASEAVGNDYTEVKPQCALTESSDFEHTGVRCTTEAQNWALRETKKSIGDAWLYVFAFLAAAWLIWLAAVAQFRAGNRGPLWLLHGIKDSASTTVQTWMVGLFRRNTGR